MDNSSQAPMGWLVIPPQETVLLLLDMATLQGVIKHYSRKERRFYRCFGATCDFCMSGTPKRRRYQVHVLLHGKTWAWEFGKQVHQLIKNLADDDKEVWLVITRMDEGRNTRYWINRAPEVIITNERDEYIRERIGNRLRR